VSLTLSPTSRQQVGDLLRGASEKLWGKLRENWSREIWPILTCLAGNNKTQLQNFFRRPIFNKLKNKGRIDNSSGKTV